MNDDNDLLERKIRSGEITEDQIFMTTTQDMTIPSDWEGDIMSYSQYYGTRVMKLNQAYIRFKLLSKSPGSSTLEYERWYHELHDDIVSHKKFWFDMIFATENNDKENIKTKVDPVHAERTTGILGTLCTSLRQRGDLKGCMEVMTTYMAVLERYQKMTVTCEDEEQKKECDGLTYKCNLIRINCGCQLPNPKMAVEAFRQIVSFEKRQKVLGVEYEMADYDGVLERFFNHNRYDEISDEDIFKVLSYTTTSSKKSEDIVESSELRACNFCDSVEEMLGNYKKCSKCHQESYCSKECQEKDWPVHKHICGNQNSTNLASSELHGIINVLMKNYTTSVETQTGHSVTSSHRNKAKVKLVQQLKEMLTKDFQHFNSQMGAIDASTDLAFSAALVDFFAKQPGYEVWTLLKLQMQQQMKSTANEKGSNYINFDEDVLNRVCNNVTKVLIMNLGDSGTQDLMRHNTIENDIKSLCKKFALEQPQYNSNKGLELMMKNENFSSRLVETITKHMEL